MYSRTTFSKTIDNVYRKTFMMGVTTMNQYIEVVRNTMEIIPTMGEALEHIYVCLKEGNLQSTVDLLQDVIEAQAAIEDGIQSMEALLEDKNLWEQAQPFRSGLSLLVEAYEQNDLGNARELMQFTLLPAFKAWQNQLVVVLQPFLRQ
jgi:hypothetical protein